VHGYKAHVATDQGAGLVRGVEDTTANVHDAAGLEAVLPPKPGDVYGDSAFTGGPAERLIISRGGRPRTVWTGIWGRGPEALARLEAHNAAVRRVRCRIEKVFGTWKRSYGLRRMRWLGLAKAGLQVRLAAMAYNLRRTGTLLHALAA
jgi:IS5 family transposase